MSLTYSRVRVVSLGLALLTLCACLRDEQQVAGVFSDAFTASLIQSRTFIDGTAVTTLTYQDLGDGLGRRPFGVDFNGDGRIDPTVSYGGQQAVFQILLSNGADGSVHYQPITIDSKRDMKGLADVAVADIDGDGRLDLVGGDESALWYFRQPAEGPTYARGWGNTEEDDELRERIEASVYVVSKEDVEALVNQSLDYVVNIDNYIITVDASYEPVAIGDMDLDGFQDIVAGRYFHVHLEPIPDGLEPIDIHDGDVLAFLNPGAAVDGRDWGTVSVGRHERQRRLDRDGASGVILYDLDGDGDLDILSSARNDNNVQVAWFENPLSGQAGVLNPDEAWTQWRVGSVRDAADIDLADLTGDGLPDVVAVGSTQQQVLLFVQPDSGPKRGFDWDTHVLVTFENFEPRSVLALDLDNDGVREVVVGCTGGAIRYFEPPADYRQEWTPLMVTDIDPAGNVGLLGYGDLDGDGDFDLVAVTAGESSANDSSLNWIRNNLIP